MASEYDLDVQVGGQSIPFFGFTVTGGVFASVGHAKINTSITALAAQGIDLLKLTENAASLTEVGIWVQPESGVRTRIFGGEYVSAHWSFDADTIEIECRDWAGVLVDQKRVLTKIGTAIAATLKADVVGQVSVVGISNQNQKVSQIVTAIAQEFGFTPVLNLDTANNPTMGSLYGSDDYVYMTVPQSLWAVLCQLARDTGYDVYVTPNKDLVFGLPAAGQDTLQLAYNLASLPDGAAPVRNLKIEHHPRRNSTFRVMVISHDGARAQATLGQAVSIGDNYAGTKGLQPGITSGTAAASAAKALAGAKASVSQVPLYTFHMEGLTADQANRAAASLALQIARCLLVLTGDVDIRPEMLPTRQIKVQGALANEFTGQTYSTSSFSHRFTMPKGDGRADERAGLVTELHGLNVPTQALAAETAG